LVPSASTLLRVLRQPLRRPQHAATVFGVPGLGLPNIEREAEEVARLLEAEDLLLGGEATLERFVELAPRCRHLHLATHGLLRPDNPGASVLRLADHWLSCRDVARLPLAAELVALSACHAGLDRIHSGDELVGLGRAFIDAGARAVLTTLWAVPDGAVVPWMRVFYRELSAGAGAAAALRQASLSAREKRPHPWAWAPFALVGHPGAGVGCRRGAAGRTLTSRSPSRERR